MPTVLFLGITLGSLLTTIGSIAIGIALTALQGVISKAFIKKPKRSPLGFDDRTLTLTGSIQPRQYLYGENRVGGTVVFISRSSDNIDVWLVVMIAGQQIQDIRDCYINDTQTLYGTDGIVNSGTYAGKITIFEHLGSTTQTADTNLTTAFPNKWTTSHTLSGCAYVAVRLIGFAANWSSSVPNFSFDVKGSNEIVDPRTSATGYTDNTALCLRHWLLNSTFGFAEPIAGLNDTSFIAAANICEQIVNFDTAVQTAFELSTTTFTATAATDLITLAANINLNTGDPVCVTTTTTLPAPLVAATVYYWIRVSATTGKLATTLDNATAGTPIDITTAGVGTHTIIDNAYVTLTPTDQTVTANAATDAIALAVPISPATNTVVRLTSTATMPAPLVAGTLYYTIPGADESHVKLALTASDAHAGTAINLTTAGTGTITLTVDSQAAVGSIATDAATDIIGVLDPVNWLTGTAVTFSSPVSVPSPLVAGTPYFWIFVSSTTGRVATSAANARAGKYIDLLDTGVGGFELRTVDNQVIDMQGLVTGDVVQAAAGTSLPGGISASTDYYWIRRGRNAGQFASSLVNALAGTFIPLTSASSGLQSLQRFRQRRFTSNGVFDGDQTREDVLKALLTSCGGFAAPMPKWAIFPASYRPPLLSLNEDHLRSGGVIELTVRNARRESFNTVTGVYVTPENFDQPSSFPQLQDPDALAEDDGDVLAKDITLPFTNNKQMALRLARIELNRARLQNTVSFPANLGAYPCQVGDTIDLSISALGWSKKTFEVMAWSFNLDNAAGSSAMLPIVDLKLRETNPSVYR